MRPTAVRAAAIPAALLALAVAGCSQSSEPRPSGTAGPPTPPRVLAAPSGLPGMPPQTDPGDVYAAARPGRLPSAVKGHPARVYVPNTDSGTVSVIDARTYEVVDTLEIGERPQHVLPSWDLRTLWVNDSRGHTLTPVDPATGRTGEPVDVRDPRNVYFTPDGKYAVVMAPLDRQLVFRDPRTWKERRTVPVSCYGVNYADFSADGRFFVASCEFSGELLKVDTERMTVVGRRKLPFERAMPQEVRLAPDGDFFYIADAMANGVWVLDGHAFTEPRLLPTGEGAHGLFVSRDSRRMYVSNRGEGTISVLDLATGLPAGKWQLPDGASPDLGGLSADGKVLWLSGRYDAQVYAVDARDGELLATVPVGDGPHGLAVHPQPGRYSLGHTGLIR